MVCCQAATAITVTYLLVWQLFSSPFQDSGSLPRIMYQRGENLYMLDIQRQAWYYTTDVETWIGPYPAISPPTFNDRLYTNARYFGGTDTAYIIASDGIIWTTTDCTKWNNTGYGPWSVFPSYRRYAARLSYMQCSGQECLVYIGGYGSDYECLMNGWITKDAINWNQFTYPEIGPGCMFRLATDSVSGNTYLFGSKFIYIVQVSSNAMVSFTYNGGFNGPVYSRLVTWSYTLGETRSFLKSSNATRSPISFSTIPVQSIHNITVQKRRRLGSFRSDDSFSNKLSSSSEKTLYMSFYTPDDPLDFSPPHNRYSISYDLFNWEDAPQTAPYPPVYFGNTLYVNSLYNGVTFIGGYTNKGHVGEIPLIYYGSANSVVPQMLPTRTAAASVSGSPWIGKPQE